MTDKKVRALENLKKFSEQEEEARREFGGHRDQVLLERMLEEDKDLQTDRNIIFRNPDIQWAPTDKYKVAMIMPPAWTVTFPPYGIAKLTALMRMYGYSVKVYDINIETYYHLLEEHGQDYWKTERHFLWSVKENFEQYLLPDIKHIFDNFINEVVKANVRVVGMSLYTTNITAAVYIAKKLREKVPDICLLAGGPETITNEKDFNPGGDAYDLFNYIFIGESEDNLIYVLENLPDELPLNEKIGTVKSRLNLEAYPYADYTDYDIRNYTEHGVSIETSRGCTAQCSFCSETYFWKFRSQDPNRVADEIEHYVNTYKVRRFWFTDSLANGDLKRFETLIDLLRERKLGIRWHSYSRCDGRMDYIFMRKVVSSGCTALSFGLESGSQKVLLDMRKKIEIWEIENNMRDSFKAGMFNHCSYMIGFPSEGPADYFNSLQTLYNVRKWIGALSLGYTTGMAKSSDIENNYKTYGIVGTEQPYSYQTTFLAQWYTEGYKNTIINRMIRLKFSYIWLEILKEHRKSIIYNSQRQETMKAFYSLDFKPLKEEIDYLEQDFNVNFNQFEGTFADTVANEYVAICYLLYKYFNRLTFTFRCDPEEDMKIFGNYIARKYKSDVYFSVDKKGNYSLIIDHHLEHDTDDEILKSKYEEEKARCDQSFKQRIEKKGHISEWQTAEPQIRETVHERYRKKQQ
jgi:hypothetical protein